MSLLDDETKKRFLDAAIDVAKMAGARAESWYFKRDKLVVEEKGAQDYVSIADKKTEELIVAELRQRFPDHAFFGEEGAKVVPDEGQPVWVIDPIDGTTNFLRGIPMFAVSIGCVIDRVPVVGVIHLPRQHETFAAAMGLGATLDNEPIKPSPVGALAKSVISVGSSTRTGRAGVNAVRTRVSEAGAEIRRLGSACVESAYVACGRVDGYLEAHLNSWDVAAALVILREAGARVNDFDAKADWLTAGNHFLCAAPGVFEALVDVTGLG